MFRPQISKQNEDNLRTIYRKDGYMKKATNIALTEYFNNHTKEEILNQLKEATTQ